MREADLMTTAAIVAAVVLFLLAHAAAVAASVCRSTASIRICCAAPSAARTTSTPHGRTAPSDKAAVAAAAARAGLQFVDLHRPRRWRPAAPDPPRTSTACCASTASRSAPTAGTTSRSTCRPRRIRSAATRRPSSRTSRGSAGSASPRTRIILEPGARLDATGRAPIDGIEWLNAGLGVAGRAERWRWRASLFDYLLRPGAGARVGVRPPGRDARRDGTPWTRSRSVVALAAARRARRRAARTEEGRAARPAARSRLRGQLPDRSRTRVLLERPLTGDGGRGCRA